LHIDRLTRENNRLKMDSLVIIYVLLAFLIVVAFASLGLAVYASVRYAKTAIGPTGPAGPAGQPGDPGPRGSNGATGPAGPTLSTAPIDFNGSTTIPSPREYFELSGGKSKVFSQVFQSCSGCSGIPEDSNSTYILKYYTVLTYMYYPPSVTNWTQYVEAVRNKTVRPYQYYYLTNEVNYATYLKVRSGVLNNSGEVVWASSWNNA